MREVFFVEGESPLANFIVRRINYLAKSNEIKVIVLVDFNDPFLYQNPMVNYIVKLNFKRFFWKSFKRFFTNLPFSLIRSLRVFPHIPRRNSKLLQKIYLAILYNEVLTVSFDVIHLQYVGQFSIVEWISKMSNKPIISSVRGAQVTYMVDSDSDYKYKIQSFFRKSNLIHCVSNSLKRRCIDLGAQEEKLFLNYNGIDTALFRPDKSKVFEGELNLITVSSLTWRKGITYQLIALKMLLQMQPTLQCKLRIIGSGPDLSLLQYNVRAMNLSEHVFFLGESCEEQIIQNLQMSHVYLSTSVAEGLSNSVMEALSTGLPVVSFLCEGIEELVKNDQNGFVIPFGNITSFVDKLNLFAHNRLMLKEYSNAARMHIVENFEIYNQLEVMVDIYKKL